MEVLRQRESKWLDMLNNWDKWMAKKHKKVSYSHVPLWEVAARDSQAQQCPFGAAFPKVCMPLYDAVGLNGPFIPPGNWSLGELSGPKPAHFCLQLFPAGLEPS